MAADKTADDPTAKTDRGTDEATPDSAERVIRHAVKRPTVLISRTAERIPFDIADLRVVRLDMTDLYAFVPQMEAWRAELTQHGRQALEQPEAAITPITLLGDAFGSDGDTPQPS